ncbi:MAG: hypothetical protein U0X87_13870 [Anaerolineales bacterium]
MLWQEGALQGSDTVFEIVLVDAASEQPVSVQKAKRHYSGKKKRHTQKQVMVDRKSTQIITTAFSLEATRLPTV